MPDHTLVSIEYQAYAGESDVFADSPSSLRDLRAPFRKCTQPRDPRRQQHFERLVQMLAEECGSRIPTFINWNGKVINRMDKGCIGHAMAGLNPLIFSYEQNDRQTVTHVNLRAN